MNQVTNKTPYGLLSEEERAQRAVAPVHAACGNPTVPRNHQGARVSLAAPTRLGEQTAAPLLRCQVIPGPKKKLFKEISSSFSFS